MIVPYLCVHLRPAGIVDDARQHSQWSSFYYFPEFVGRIVTFVWFSIVRTGPVVRFHAWLMPVTTILYYSDLLVEMTIMQETPLGGHPVEGDEIVTSGLCCCICMHCGAH